MRASDTERVRDSEGWQGQVCEMAREQETRERKGGKGQVNNVCYAVHQSHVTRLSHR